MMEITLWFKNEVERWRRGASVAWCVVLLLPALGLFSLLANIDIFHPYSWITKSLICVLSPGNWLYILVLAVVVIAVAAVNAAHYTVRPTVLCSRAAVIWSVVKPSRLLHTVGHGLAAALITWCYTGLVDSRYKAFSKHCNDQNNDVYCLNEGHVFLMLNAFYLGCVYAATFFIHQNNYLAFSLIQQSRFFQVKSQLAGFLWSSALHTLKMMKYFYVAYYLLLGHIFKKWVFKNMDLQQKESDAVDSVSGLLDLGLLYQVLLTGTLIHFLFGLTALLYKVYQTQPFEFPIEVSMENYKNKCLHNAMACRIHPLIQYIGYLDLYLLSKNSSRRRRELFNLTQLGGHPHNWNNISTECLAMLKGLSEDIVSFNTLVFANGPTRQLSGDKQSIAQHKGPLSGTTGSVASAFGTPVTNISYRGGPVTSTPLSTSHNLPSSQTAAGVLRKPTITDKIYNHLKKRKAIAFFLSDLPDAASRRLFRDAQLHVWAVEALSHLAVASFTEDTYGVVQKTLSDIISTLLTLQEAVEKHFKLATNINKRPVDDGALRFALKSSLRSALYRIITAFDKHLDGVSLSSEHKKRLSMFLDYRE